MPSNQPKCESRVAAPSGATTALIADDHSLLLVGLAILLREEFGFTNVLEAATLEAARHQLAANPGTKIAFFDLCMPGMTGAATLRTVRAENPDLKIVMLSASENAADAAAALAAGANGYIPKSFAEEKLITAISAVLEGETFEPPLLSMKDIAKASSTGGGGRSRLRPGVVLTKRQQEIVECVRKGLSNRQIAQKLNLTENTVSNHLSNLFLIFSVRNRTELALLS